MSVIVGNKDIDIGTSDVPDIKTFQISYRHIDITAYDLSKLWSVILAHDKITLKNTKKKFFCSSVLMLARIYCAYRVFIRKTLQGKW